MDRKFWRDLYPMSETRRRFTQSSWAWIYLPIGASILIAAWLAVAILGFAPEDGYMQGGQLATIILAGGMLAAGFFSWLVILVCLWGVGDVMRALPALTTRMRLRFVTGADTVKRMIHTVKRTAASVLRIFSPNKIVGLNRWPPSSQRSGRRKLRDE
ncbi:MAG: hypothetical protein JW748_04215 [Anaerolineales bacterium]|nr:hypothetical protein [Anaerolineales bacterium]